MADQSVSRTAIRMNQSQPAISAALKRLREIFGDPLLVRDKNTMVPTPRALAAAAQARAALALIDGLVSSGESFDPATTEQAFTIAMPDYLAPPFLRGVVESGLTTMRVGRDRRVECPYFSLAPSLLPGTDLIMTTSRHFAQYHAERLDVAIVPSPIPFPAMRFYQLWHSSQHRAAAHV